MSKKKTIVRTLLKHLNNGSYFSGEWSMVVSTCSCGWEKEAAERDQAVKLHAKHVYAMIKKTLRKRRQILSL